MATAAPQKGGRGMFVICLDFIDENGDAKVDILIKSDTEEAMRLLVRSIQEERHESKTVVEEVPKGSKGSDGVVERAVQEIEGRIRSLLLSLEERLNREVDAKERIVAFIPQYAAYLYNRLHRGDDGKVGYERVK
eukprot:6511772-Karenia_brevis.AAC.1